MTYTTLSKVLNVLWSLTFVGFLYCAFFRWTPNRY